MTRPTIPVSHVSIDQRLDWWVAVAQSVRMQQADQSLSTTKTSAAESAEIAAAVAGNSDAYGKILLRHQTTIAQQMSRFSRDASVIEELVHDVFVEAFLSLPKFKNKSPLEHWLRKIAVRVGYKYWKTTARDKDRKNELLSSDELRQRLVETPTQPTEAADQLHGLLSQLSHRDRLVLTLIYWDDCSVAEAAQLTGWSQSLVKVQAYRARKRMKQLLEEREHESQNP